MTRSQPCNIFVSLAREWDTVYGRYAPLIAFAVVLFLAVPLLITAILYLAAVQLRSVLQRLTPCARAVIDRRADADDLLTYHRIKADFGLIAPHQLAIYLRSVNSVEVEEAWARARCKLINEGHPWPPMELDMLREVLAARRLDAGL